MGGLLWSALGGAVANAGNAMAGGYYRQAQQEDEERRDERRMQSQISMQEQAEQRKVEREEAGNAKQRGLIAQAEAAADSAGKERRFEKFRSDARADGAQMDEATLRETFDKQYDQKVVGRFEGGDRYVERVSTARQDVFNELGKLGANSETMRNAKASVDSALTAERDMAKERRDQAKDEVDNRRLDESERRNRVTEAQRDRQLGIQLQATLASINKKDKPDGDDKIKLTTALAEVSRTLKNMEESGASRTDKEGYDIFKELQKGIGEELKKKFVADKKPAAESVVKKPIDPKKPNTFRIGSANITEIN